MKNEKISATIEDYLIAIFIMERDGEPVTGVRLAELLGVTSPTVTNTLKRMARDGLITIGANHAPGLTLDGYQAASAVMRRHMLVEWMLNPLLSWSKLHKEAHALEHAISNEVETALLEELHHPQICPHGNPFPGYEDAVAGWLPLTRAAVGARGVVRRIHEFAENNLEVMAFLDEKGLVNGREVTVQEILPFNETITLGLEGRPVTLGFAIARYIYIELR